MGGLRVGGAAYVLMSFWFFWEGLCAIPEDRVDGMTLVGVSICVAQYGYEMMRRDPRREKDAP